MKEATTSGCFSQGGSLARNPLGWRTQSVWDWKALNTYPALRDYAQLNRAELELCAPAATRRIGVARFPTTFHTAETCVPLNEISDWFARNSDAGCCFVGCQRANHGEFLENTGRTDQLRRNQSL